MKKQPKRVKEKKGGVTLSPLNGHPTCKWRVSYNEGGKWHKKCFRTKTGEGGALEFAEAKRDKLRNEGHKHADISDDERQAVIKFRQLVAAWPEGHEPPSLIEAVELLDKTKNIRGKNITVRELVEKFSVYHQNKRNKRGKLLSRQHVNKIAKHLQRFEDEYGDWLACDVSREVVKKWLDELKVYGTDGKITRRAVSNLTRRHYWTSLGLFFGYGLKQGYVIESPMDLENKPGADSGEIGILKPQQVAGLLTHANDEILPALALGFFAGIRRAELGRLDWSEVDFEQGHIDIKRDKAKTASRRLIKMRDNLRAWLTPHRQHEGPVMPSEAIWRKGVADAMKMAKIKAWPHNAARHSFASYHLAAFQNAESLALEMGHSTTDMIFEHYRALVSPRLAEQYWSIEPAAEDKVLRLA